MTLESLTDLLIEELQDAYDFEHQLLDALPLMAERTFDPDLQSLFEEHAEQTKEQIGRLDSIFKLLKILPSRKTCAAMEGILEEAQELLDNESDADPDVLDAALISAAQKAEHYEIASYGSARSYARILKASEIQELLQHTLDEESETDRKLTAIAEEQVNLDAAEADDEIQKEAATTKRKK